MYSLAYPTARRGGLRGAGGISTDTKIAANIDRGCGPKNRSAAVVPSERVRKKFCTAVKQDRFLRAVQSTEVDQLGGSDAVEIIRRNEMRMHGRGRRLRLVELAHLLP